MNTVVPNIILYFIISTYDNDNTKKQYFQFIQFIQFIFLLNWAMDQCISQNQKYSITLLYRSGKSFDTTGLYYQCLESVISTIYYFVLFKNPDSIDSNRVFMGMCLSNTCTPQMVQQEIDGVLMSQNYPLRVYSVTVPSEYEYAMGGTFWFTVIFLAILASLVLLATVMMKLRNKKINKYLKCFALQDNLKIFQTRQSSLTYFNGIKSICLFWIVLGHSNTIRVIDTENWINLDTQFKKLFILIPLGAFFAVDVFFYVGGFLLGYVFFTQLKKNKVIIYILAIVHRLLRFYPSYLTAILIWYQIFPHTGTGPFWPLQQRFVDPCRHMWKNVLFIDNMWNQISCLPWAWYLSNDVQLFIVCIFVLFIYTRNKRIGRGFILLAMVGSVVYNFVKSYKEGYTTVAHIRDIFTWNDYFFSMYIKPWSRCPPYLFGLIVGIEYYYFFMYEKQLKAGQVPENTPLLYKVKQVFLNKTYIRYLSYAVGIFLMVFMIFIPRKLQLGTTATWTQTQHSLYLSCSKIFFIFGLFFMTLPATVGIKDFVIFLFDTKLFGVVGKISFWTYLIHYMVIMRNSYNLKQTEYFTPIEIFHRYLTDLSIALFLGFVMTMMVEAPFVKLEKFLLKREKKTDVVKVQPENSTTAFESNTESQGASPLLKG